MRQIKLRGPASFEWEGINVSQVLRRLHDDHINVRRVLSILERQINAMDRGGRPDWDIVQGIIEYLMTYPDLRHHPLENRVFAQMQRKDARTAQDFAGLEVEHREQSEALRRIAAATLDVLGDASMARQGYAGLLRSFAAAQRDHIRREEETFFPAAKRVLDEVGWAELEREMPAMLDPLFDDRIERRFGMLRQELTFLDAADQIERRAEGFEHSGIIPGGRIP